MKNVNYNLVKLLHTMLDTDWRIKKYYMNDARDHGCSTCQKLLAELHRDAKKTSEDAFRGNGSARPVELMGKPR